MYITSVTQGGLRSGLRAIGYTTLQSHSSEDPDTAFVKRPIAHTADAGSEMPGLQPS